MRWTWLVVALGGCAPWLALPDTPPPPPGLVEVEAGRYSGTAVIEVRAYSGPVQVGREECRAPIALVVDPADSALVRGEVACSFVELGRVEAELVGDGADLPWVDGQLVAEALTAGFSGWFVAADDLYLELDGEAPRDSLRLRYRGYLRADRYAPLSGTVGP